MNERPILFSAPMVNAILAGTKTQTRRVAKLTHAGRVMKGGRHWHPEDPCAILACPYGAAGDLLWAKETWSKAKSCNVHEVFYRADGETSGKQTAVSFIDREKRWRPSIHMPRWASRITLKITEARVERLQDISEADAVAEGVRIHGELRGSHWYAVDGVHMPAHSSSRARDAYAWLWSSINGLRSWDANPYVWCVSFERVKP